jgi:hypothetical protein
MYSQILVPTKSLELPPDFKDMSNEEQANKLAELQVAQPDKFERKNIIVGDNEKNKANIKSDSNGKIDVDKISKRKLDASQYKQGYKIDYNASEQEKVYEVKLKSGKTTNMTHKQLVDMGAKDEDINKLKVVK